jgi:hypothetical protein
VSSPKVLDDAKTKIAEYEVIGKKYNRAYRMVLEARRGKDCLVEENGSISHEAISVMANTLRIFLPRTAPYLVETLDTKLKEKLSSNEIMVALRRLRFLKISSLPETEENVMRFKVDAENLYGVLSADDEESLDRRGYRFCVGATKIMNFLFPDLFVITDTHVQKAIFDCSLTNFEFNDVEWRAMKRCAIELSEWEATHGSLQSLLELDAPLTAITRVFDKCAFIMGKHDISIADP